MTTYIDDKGAHHAIPNHFADVKLTRTGLPDKRDRRYADFMAWVAGLNTHVDAVGSVPDGQALASRIWEGQSPDLPRNERMRRIKAALEDKGLTMEGVNL